MANAPSTNKTANTDIDGFVRRANRYIIEVAKSQSSGISGTMSFDVARVKTYTTAMRKYINYITAQPVLDLPETGPTEIDLPAKVEVPRMENDSSYDLCALFKLAVDEISDSQSSRIPTNLLPFDKLRILAIIDRADNFIDTFIVIVDPLDVPETSPSVPSTGPGIRGGV